MKKLSNEELLQYKKQLLYKLGDFQERKKKWAEEVSKKIMENPYRRNGGYLFSYEHITSYYNLYEMGWELGNSYSNPFPATPFHLYLYCDWVIKNIQKELRKIKRHLKQKSLDGNKKQQE